MKKNNPGCLCCGEECFRCSFQCDGDQCPSICGLRINLSAVDDIPLLADENCPPPEETCPESAPCNGCYYLFDQIFPLPFGAPYGWLYSFEINAGSDAIDQCEDYTHIWDYADGVQPVVPCWDSTNYACPYVNDSLPFFCGPELYISDAQVKARSQWNKDTKCGTITVTITIRVFRDECLIAIGEEYESEVFTYLFELDYCTCEEMIGGIPFVSSTGTENPTIGLKDPCNLEGATINLISAERGSPCPSCLCWECSFDNVINLSITGPGFTGTIPLEFGLPFVFIGGGCGLGAFVEFDCPASTQVAIGMGVDCLDCEFYNLRLRLETGDDFVYAEIENYQCGQSRTFEIKNSSPGGVCQLGNHVFSV